MADTDVQGYGREETETPKPPATPPQVKTSKTDAEVGGMAGLSPMRTHEMNSGHEHSVADRMCHLVDESDEDDGHEEKDVNHEKLKRKELRRQKTHDKPNRLRDRLKRTVSKAAE